MVFRHGINKIHSDARGNPSAPRTQSVTMIRVRILRLSTKEAKSPVNAPTTIPMNASLRIRKVSERGGVNTEPYYTD
jgi:hypothetical protein